MADISKYADKIVMDFIGVNAEEELRNRGYDYGWYKKDCVELAKILGSIYILVEPHHQNEVKIGFSQNILKDMEIWNEDGTEEFHCYALYDVVAKVDANTLWVLFEGKSDGWVSLSKEKAYGILESMAKIHNRYSYLKKNPFNDVFFTKKVDTTIFSGDIIEHVDFGIGEVVGLGTDSHGRTYIIEFDNASVGRKEISVISFQDGFAWKTEK